MSGRGHNDEFVIPANLGHQVFIAYRTLDNTDVNLIAFHHVENTLGIGYVKPHRNVGKLCLILAQNAWDHVLTDGGTRAQNQWTQDISG